jgi:hypothetical protein
MTDEAAPQPSPSKPDFKANFAQLPLVEKVLVVIALVIIIGWIMTWSRSPSIEGAPGLGEAFERLVRPGFFSRWFTPLSFFGAMAITALVTLKVFGIRPLPPHIESKVIPIASLVPVLGYLIDLINSPAAFLTVGGSIALAYISATTYWKRRIPEFATAPLGSSPAQGSAPHAPPAG